MRRSALPLALGVAMLAAAPATAQIGSAEPSAREVASVFKDVCLDKTTEGFSNFESNLAAWGYAPDGAGYYLNGVHTTSFQLWRGEGAVFCTLFYNKTAPDVVRWTTEVMSAALDRAPGAILNDSTPRRWNTNATSACLTPSGSSTSRWTAAETSMPSASTWSCRSR